MAGAQGAIAATANLLPQVVVGIYDKFQEGDMLAAEQEQRKLKALRGAFKLGTMPSVLKQALNEAGTEVGVPRLPALPVTEEVKQTIQGIVETYRTQGEV